MTGYLLDTNHAGALLRGDQDLVAAIRQHAPAAFHIAAPSIGELWYMVHNSARIPDNARRLRVVLASLLPLPFDAAAAETFGEVRAPLRRNGRPIPPIDIQIAAVALRHGLIVLTADAHFDAVHGLVSENWL